MVEFQCVQTCYPNIPSQPELLFEICNQICPFNPSATDLCSKCPKMIDNLNPEKRNSDERVEPVEETQPESLIVEPRREPIQQSPEVKGQQMKQCCYLNTCRLVPMHEPCHKVCYEPCNAECTGRCLENPECPNQCKEVAAEKMRMRFKIWLGQKLKEISLKYRREAAACLLRTKLSYEGEMKRYVQQAQMAIGAPVIEVEREMVGGSKWRNPNVWKCVKFCLK